MSAIPQAASNAPPIPSPVFSNVTNSTPLTRVSLAFVERRINLYLRFGHPVRELRLDRWRRCALFLPAALFCRVRWESNDYGTTRWQLMVLQACSPLNEVQRIAGIQPHVRLLLHAKGEQQVQSVLPQIDTIETLGIDPVAVSPAYWRTLGNRLSARLARACRNPIRPPPFAVRAMLSAGYGVARHEAACQTLPGRLLPPNFAIKPAKPAHGALTRLRYRTVFCLAIDRCREISKMIKKCGCENGQNHAFFGPVAVSTVIGSAQPLWTWNTP